MKIGICVNHSYPHVGGSEKVAQQIAESLVSSCNCQCLVFSGTTKNPFVHNNVEYHPIFDLGAKFVDYTKKLGIQSMLVYSDYFRHWPIMINNPKSLGYKLALATVGMNATLEKPILLKRLVQNKDIIKLITHSNSYQDYKLCEAKGLDTIVIPNGVDLNEFKVNKGLFRSKYDLKDKKILLCVSNFFPGKGQEHLIPICKSLSIKDYCLVSISSTPSFQAAEILKTRFKNLSAQEGINMKMFTDLPREEVISAFIDADIFVFPTQKEVAPLVVLEAMAAQTPWISMPVGNVASLEGGIVIPSNGKDPNGNCLYNEQVYELFAKYISTVVNDENFSKELTDKGIEMISSTYSWDSIFKSYYDVLTR